MDDVTLAAEMQPIPPIIDPIDAVTDLLREAQHPDPEAWLTRLPGGGTVATLKALRDAPLQAQRVAVNRALRSSLLDRDIDEDTAITTMDQRYCIVDTGEIDVWKQLIKDAVVPCMVEYNLPRTKV